MKKKRNTPGYPKKPIAKRESEEKDEREE